MRGGVDRHIAQLEEILAGQVRVAKLVSQPRNYVKLSLGTEAWYFDQRSQFDDLLAILSAMQVCYIHIHHLFGFRANFWQLPDRLQLPYSFTVHDYGLINGSTTLNDREGYFLQDFATQNSPSLAQLPAWCVDLQQWKKMNAALLGSAEQVFYPCEFTGDLFRAHYPGASYRHCFHPDWEIDAPYPPVRVENASSGKLRVAVLGMLSREKGADRLDACAIAAREKALPIEFVHFGQAYRRLSDCVTALGRYEDRELPQLMTAQSIDLVWFPALCAEVYSYTLSHCLRLGLPVLAPDVGAFAERLAGRPLSFIFPYRSSVSDILAQLEAIRQQLQRGDHSQAWPGQVLPSQREYLYRRDYLAMLPDSAAASEGELSGFSSYLKRPAALGRAEFKTRLLRLLLSLSNTALFGLLQRVVPYDIQKRLKRLLSDKPLHELGS